MNKNTFLRSCSSLLLGFSVAMSFSACATAIPPKPISNLTDQNEEKSAFYDKLASAELNKIQRLVEEKIDTGSTYQQAGDEIRNKYTPSQGVEWSYSPTQNDDGYILKVWIPAGGSFTTEEDSMEIESYGEIPEDDHEH